MGIAAHIFFQWQVETVEAMGSDIEIESFSAKSEFPEGIRFEIVASSTKPVNEIAVNFRIGQQVSGVYEYLEFYTGPKVKGILFWKTNTGAKYIPPGTIVEYSFTVSNESGDVINSENYYLVYEDTRFEWDEIESGTISVAYHGPVKSRAEDILDAMNLKENEVLNKMGRLLRLIEETNPSIDDAELRWVEHQIDKFNEGTDYYGQPITKNDLRQANLYWKKYTK